MIIYHPQLSPNFEKYGIKVPIAPNRSTQVFNSLDINPVKMSDLEEVTQEDLLRVHNSTFIKELLDPKKSYHLIEKCYELNNSEYIDLDKYKKENVHQLVLDMLLQVSGTYYSCLDALSNKYSYFLGGGMHHAMSFRPHGFCLVNDLIISIKKLQIEGLIKNALIIDIDAHKGDGSAEISQRDKSIFTYSIHMKSGWPLGGSNIDIPSSLDVPVDKNENYQDLLISSLNSIDFNKMDFDLAIIVQGADVSESDTLLSSSGICLNEQEILERDEYIFNLLKDNNIAQSYVMAGGYGPNAHKPYINFLSKFKDYFLRGS